MTKVAVIYSAEGFSIERIYVDGQLNGISEKLSNINIFVNVTSRNENVPKAKWYI